MFCEDSKRIKHPAWGIRSQGWNPKEVTGIWTSGGACGLMRQSARKLTSSWHPVGMPSISCCLLLSDKLSVGTGAAWLSSARAVRWRVNSLNERNPFSLLLITELKEKQPCDERGGRRGRRQVCMALMNWATHVLQW